MWHLAVLLLVGLAGVNCRRFVVFQSVERKAAQMLCRAGSWGAAAAPALHMEAAHCRAVHGERRALEVHLLVQEGAALHVRQRRRVLGMQGVGGSRRCCTICAQESSARRWEVFPAYENHVDEFQVRVVHSIRSTGLCAADL